MKMIPHDAVSDLGKCGLFDDWSALGHFSWIDFTSFSVKIISMSEISRFLGIRVEMFYDDHLPPHFHARYEGERAVFTLDGGLMEGSMSKQAQRLLREWAGLHPSELAENWDLAEKHLPLNRIPPLT
jgi:Domain of unknown function (DUF4160)